MTIKGTRRTLLKEDLAEKDALSASLERVELDVDLRGAPADTAANLPALLFFEGPAPALRALPLQIAGFLPMRFGHPQGGESLQVDGKWQRRDRKVPFVQQRMVYAPEPQFSEEARANKVSGNVMVGLVTNAQGTVDEVWLLRPIGLGLDERAMQAARAYRFTPAQYDGRPVGTTMAAEVNFQIY